jgi:glycosyltransferase involved in cell wall biosynthesis
MKKKFIEELMINSNKIEVKRPKVDITIKEQFWKTKDSLSTFFYPASGVVFKNHKVIVDACLKLKEEDIGDYKVIFTLNGDENKHIAKLYNTVEENQLPIEFRGSIQRDEVFRLYLDSVLLFTSYIETVGLPLIEARMHGTPIIAPDLEYSNEILLNYESFVKVNVFDSNDLYRALSIFINS